MKIEVHPFGFKYGIPRCNFIVDVSFLKNPSRQKEFEYFVSNNAKGNTPEMKEFVLNQEAAQKTLAVLIQMVEHFYEHVLVKIGVGCTGGRHRSVIIAEELGKKLNEKGYDARIIYQDR